MKILAPLRLIFELLTPLGGLRKVALPAAIVVVGL